MRPNRHSKRRKIAFMKHNQLHGSHRKERKLMTWWIGQMLPHTIKLMQSTHFISQQPFKIRNQNSHYQTFQLSQNHTFCQEMYSLLLPLFNCLQIIGMFEYVYPKRLKGILAWKKLL